MNLRFWQRAKQEKELDDEIQSHLRMAAQERIEAGHNPRDAEAEARRELGNQGLIKDATREVWGLGWIERLVQDLRYGFRVLWKSPVYALVSVFTLALGIGASTAIFSVVYGVLLRSLPFQKPEQIVRLWEVDARGNRMQFADPNFEDMRAQAHSLQAAAELSSWEQSVEANNKPDRVRVAYVSKDFFSVMGVQTVVGRLFVPEEQHFGAAPAALVSYSYWQRHLQAATDLGAAKLTVSKHPTTIVGVLSPGFHFPDDSQIWLARETDAQLPSRSAHNWQVVARLRDGTSLNQARAEVSALAHRIYQQYGPHDINMVDAAILPLREALTTDVKPALLVLFAVASLLLLVACANVMNLSLAQASARAGELAIRSALGASRWRLIRQFLAEALLLCILGGAVGVLAAQFGVRALLAMAPSNIPRLDEISINLPVLLFALALSVVVAGGLGTFTAVRSTTGDVQIALAEGGRGQGNARQSQRTGRTIVAAQVAVTLTLLVGAGLLARSMLRVLSIYPGFQTRGILTLDLKLPGLEANDAQQRVQFLEQLITRLQAIPGVRDVGGTSVLPLSSAFFPDGTFLVLNAQQLSPAERELMDRSAHVSWDKADPALLKDLTDFFTRLFSDRAHTGYADYVVASEGYFRCLGVPLLRGRLFNESDATEAPHVAVISESVARQKWPDQDPLGQTIEFGNMDGDVRLLTIVGIVGDIRANTLESLPRPTIYVNYRQRPRATHEFGVMIRTNSDPAVIFPAARRILAELDPSIPPRFNTFDQVFSASLNGRRFNLVLVGTFALAALLLAMAGIFGVLAYSVARRTREIGVRIALGATVRNVLKLILEQAMLTTIIGIGIGLIASFILTRTMRSLLFEVSATDPVTLLGVALLLTVVALAASYVPARRATRVDPMVALRYE